MVETHFESTKPIRCIEIIESKPIGSNFRKIPQVFNYNFNTIQNDIIKLLHDHPGECLTNGKIDYGKIYLKLLEKDGIINIQRIPDRLLSPESPDRIIRKLMEYAENGNKELNFLLKYKKDSVYDQESKEFYRSN